MYKIIIINILLLALSACHFKPLHSRQNDIDQYIETIKLSVPNNINGYIIKRHLQSYLHPNKDSSNYKYRLIIENINSHSTEIAKASTGVAARQQLIIYVPYKLICLSNQSIIKSSTINSTSSYDTSGTPFANTVNDNHLLNKIMQEVARDLYWQIIEIFENENPHC